MTSVVAPFVVGIVCALVGWILGYWNGASSRVGRWTPYRSGSEGDE